MTKEIVKFAAKFTAIGMVAAIALFLIGVPGDTAADISLAIQMIWVGWNIA